MISISYYPDITRHDKREMGGFRSSGEAMAWVLADATSRYAIESTSPHHGFWFWYKLYRNGKQIGGSDYLIRPLLSGKNKGKPAIFRYNWHKPDCLYQLKSKHF